MPMHGFLQDSTTLFDNICKTTRTLRLIGQGELPISSSRRNIPTIIPFLPATARQRKYSLINRKRFLNGAICQISSQRATVNARIRQTTLEQRSHFGGENKPTIRFCRIVQRLDSHGITRNYQP